MFIRHQPRHSCRRLLAAVLLALFQRVSSVSFPPSCRLVPLTASCDLLIILLRFGVLEVNKKSCPPLILHTIIDFRLHSIICIHCAPIANDHYCHTVSLYCHFLHSSRPLPLMYCLFTYRYCHFASHGRCSTAEIHIGIT